MRRRVACGAFLGWFAISAGALLGAAFQDLDFESATIASAPANYEPWDAFDAISAAAALPGWTVVEDSTVCDAVWGEAVALDETSVALGRSYPYGDIVSTMDGNYFVELSAIGNYTNVPAEYFSTSSISQTGDIPGGTRSITFLLRDAVAYTGEGPSTLLQLTINGVVIPYSPVASYAGGIEEMAGDVSAFSGTTATVEFELGSGTALYDLSYDIDDINFSRSPAPEPAFGGTCAIALVSTLCRRQRAQ
jgi:hypothetical protein